VTALSGLQELELRRTLEKLWSETAAELPNTESGAMASAELALRVPDGPLRLAVDGAGHRHLLIPVPAKDPAVDDWHSAGVRLRTTVRVVDDAVVRFLDLECRRDDLNGVFTGLATEVCAIVAAHRETSAYSLTNILESWRELLSGARQRWTVPRLAGLYGELLVLERLLRDDPDATASWVGPSGATQDFSRNTHALEVKTSVSPTGRLVRIHGIDQLERPESGSLALIWARVNALERGVADDIPSCVQRCLASASSAALLSRLDQIGLPSLASVELHEISFDLVERRIYEVDSSFPRITPDQFIGHAVPGGVHHVEYIVDLDTVPVSELDLADVVDRFLERA
jgi:hypothetical protein